MKQKPKPDDSSGFSGEDLTFPPLDPSWIRPNELVGYHSYLNWLVPEHALGQSLKLSLLFVDKIIAECDDESRPEFMIASLAEEGRLTKRAGRELLDLVVPIQLIVPQFGMKNLFREHEDEFLDFVTEYHLDQEYVSKGKELLRCEGRSLYDTRYWVTATAFENWFALSKQMSTLFIPNYSEEPVLRDFLHYLQAYNDPRTKHDYYKFRAVLTRILPSVDKLSFDEVLELRHHEYFASFRARAGQIVDRILSVSNLAEITRVIKEQEQADIRTLEDLFRPRPHLALLRVLIGSIPIPVIPLNPVGVYEAIDTIRKERKAAKEVGWVYFARDLEESNPQGRGMTIME